MPSDKPAWTREMLGSPHDVADKAGRVQQMFNSIAPRYELVNRIFSGGRDAAWRRRAVTLAKIRADDEVLDIACGTGDFARAFAGAGPRRVVGCDFAHAMLRQATLRGDTRIGWCEADALRLPFAPGSFSVATCAFGVRNFADLDAGLAEMYRVLRPGGRVVVLEFTRPKGRMVRGLYEFYTRHVMPVAAGWISGDRDGAYRYLPRSVVSFLDAEQFLARLARVGFVRAKVTPLTMGAVSIYVASRE